MTIQIVERPDSPRINNSRTQPSAEFLYHAYGSDALEDIKAVFEPFFTPEFYLGLHIEGVNYDWNEVAWEITLRYGIRQPKELGDVHFTFDIAGQQQRVKQALETIKSYPEEEIPFAPAPDYSGAIGVDGDKVEGVDILVPQPKFTITAYLANSLFLSYGYFDLLCELVGTVNDGFFYGRQRGEVLLVGAKGSRRGREQNWEMSFDFIVERNVTNKLVCSNTAIDHRELRIDKLGHDVFWLRSEPEYDSTAKSTVKKPRFGYVERVYKFEDFSRLGLGG